MSNYVVVSGKAWIPEARYTSTGMCIAEVSISVYKGKNKETQQSEYFNIKVKAFKDLAETLASDIQQGDRIQVIGRLSEEKWETKEGETKRRNVIFAESIGKELQQYKPQGTVDFGKFGRDVTDEEVPF